MRARSSRTRHCSSTRHALPLPRARPPTLHATVTHPAYHQLRTSPPTSARTPPPRARPAARDHRPLPHAQHAEYEALSTHAWRVRTFSGQLLLEVAEVNPPPAESGDVVSVYVRECEWFAQG